ncbi:hypothetical protein HJC23_012659 [Cyclotella cryptica]|uniref:Uncharacterized protein n=1 Tax=Cyclotella cryptica TaxID=29204 RepID=A0ABD3QM26_9STRA
MPFSAHHSISLFPLPKPRLHCFNCTLIPALCLDHIRKVRTHQESRRSKSLHQRIKSAQNPKWSNIHTVSGDF